MENTIVEAVRVRREFGPITAVRDVDLRIRRGEIFGLIGHNGAGKSTLFKMMLGLIVPTAGEIRIDGQAVNGPGARELRRRIGYLPEHLALYDNLSARETLHFFADMKGVARVQCAPLLDQVGLSTAADRPVREFSKGMRQRLGFAQALLGTPAVLFLDEPTNGLDPVAIREFYQTLRSLRERGTTIILSSHILTEIQARTDRLAIMRNGEISACGSVDQLRLHLDAPLRAFVHGAADLPARLPALLGGCLLGAIEVQERGLTFSFAAADKMRVLAVIATLGSEVSDFRVIEPTLEDVYFGQEA